MPIGIYLHKPHSEERKRKISLANKGRVFTDEHKSKLSLARTGKKLTEETKVKMSMAKKGNYYTKGKHWKLSEETKRKIGESIRGEKHYLWIKDRKLLKTGINRRYDTQYKYWMLAVKKRDGWKCKIANENCMGRLEAHHILPWKDYPELRYEINNGITLCQYHHPHKKEEVIELLPHFQRLVANVNYFG